MNKEKVSVIIPVYNSESFLDRLYMSLSLQYYDHIEYIFVDDGSTDESRNLIQRFQDNDPNVRYIYQENAGTSAARNTGLRYATGDYIAFIDSDDYVLPDFIARMVSCIEETGADLVLTGVICEENGGITLREHEDYDVVKNQIDFMKDIFLKIKATYIVCNKLFRREIIGTDAFLPGYTFEDMYVSYMTALKVKKAAYISDDLYVYCIRQASVYTTNSDRQFTDFAYLANLIINTYIENGLAGSLYEEMLVFLRNGIQRMRRIYMRSDKKDVSLAALDAAVESMHVLEEKIRRYRGTGA